MDFFGGGAGGGGVITVSCRDHEGILFAIIPTPIVPLTLNPKPLNLFGVRSPEAAKPRPYRVPRES